CRWDALLVCSDAAEINVNESSVCLKRKAFSRTEKKASSVNKDEMTKRTGTLSQTTSVGNTHHI
ncbi:Hypothetical predicted protein, partial [Scomber scombrus]